MLNMVYKKMRKNLWMVLCLFIGVVLAITMVCSIPIYSRGIHQRLLEKSMEDMLRNKKIYPGAYTVTKEFTAQDYEGPSDILSDYKNMDNTLIPHMVNNLKLPVLNKKSVLTIEKMRLKPIGYENINLVQNYSNLESVSDIENHINIESGRMFSKDVTENGEYEVIVSAKTMKVLDLSLNSSYIVNTEKGLLKPFKVKVVGIYKYKDSNDPFWFQGDWEHPYGLILNYSLFTEKFLPNQAISINRAVWEYALDYSKITFKMIPGLVSEIDDHVGMYSIKKTELSFMLYDVLKDFVTKEKKLTKELWIFEIPVFIMLIFYISMISGLIVESEKDEIAVLKSRGANRRQILSIYFMESIILGGAAILAGPPLGVLFCRMLGASNGFLEFIERTGLKVSLTANEYLYSIIVVAIFMVTMLVPVFKVSKTSIVVRKQSKSRRSGKPFWKRVYLDVLLMCISLYGLYSYNVRNNIISITKAKALDIPVDPLLYVISTLFVLSIGLMFLRLYPYILKGIFHIGRNKWSPEAYASLINVSRTEGRDQFLMLFLIMTLSIGIFNIEAAGNINGGLENKVRYLTGADIRVKAEWKCNELGGTQKGKFKVPIIYEEPPYQNYSKLAGIESSTKVFTTTSDVMIKVKDTPKNGGLIMGIVPNEFGKVAWFNPELLPSHWYNYLNLLSQNQRAVLVSKKLAEQYGISKGSTIYYKWGDCLYVDGIVYGIVDYWPGYNPYSDDKCNLIVANLSYLQKKMPLQPYEVWMKKQSDFLAADKFYKDLKEKKLSIDTIVDADEELIRMKNEPMLQGTNGALTLGFIATMIITGIGFLIYWMLSIKNRTLQFGILRAIGLSMKNINQMIILEQLLVTGVGIAMGIVVGKITGTIFLPLITMVSDDKEKVLPLNLISCTSDYIKLSIIIAVIIIIGITVISKYVSRIKMDQAIKLGED